MSIPRTSTGGFLTDSDGTPSTGTVLTNAERQAMLDLIDARWTQQTISLAGTQNDLSITSSGVEADRLIFANASDVTLTGIAAPTSPAKPGKPLQLYSTGAGLVILNDQDAGSSAANRVITNSGVQLYLAAGIGRAEIVYDSLNSRWRVLSHDQGDMIAWPTTWSAASGSAPAIGNGTLASTFYLRGRICDFEISLTAGSTTTFGSGGQLQFSLPFTADGTAVGTFLASYINTGTAVYHGRGYSVSSTTIALYTNADPAAAVTSTAPFTFGNTDLIRVTGRYVLA